MGIADKLAKIKAQKNAEGAVGDKKAAEQAVKKAGEKLKVEPPAVTAEKPASDSLVQKSKRDKSVDALTAEPGPKDVEGSAFDVPPPPVSIPEEDEAPTTVERTKVPKGREQSSEDDSAIRSINELLDAAADSGESPAGDAPTSSDEEAISLSDSAVESIEDIDSEPPTAADTPSAMEEEVEELGSAEFEMLESSAGSSVDVSVDSAVAEVEESPVTDDSDSMDLESLLAAAGVGREEPSVPDISELPEPTVKPKEKKALTKHKIVVQNPGDKTKLRLGYAVTYLGQKGPVKEFVLLGDDVKEKFTVSPEQGYSKTLQEGAVTIKVRSTSTGVQALVEGGKNLGQKLKDGISKIGQFFAGMKPYLPEILFAVPVTVSAAIGMASGWLAPWLGGAHALVLGAAAVAVDTLFLLSALDKRKDMKKGEA